MKVKKLEFYPVVLKRTEPFVIATGSSTTASNIFVKIETDSGIEGWGNACPTSITKETTETVKKALKLFSKVLVGAELTPNSLHRKMGKIILGNQSAKAGVDIAMCDAISRAAGLPLYKLLGGAKDKMVTDITIGIMSQEEAVRKAVQHKRNGFKALKIKVGLDIEKDIMRVGAIREVSGERMKIRVDANQGYGVKEAVRFTNEIERYDIEVVEQPVKWNDLKGLKKVKEESPIPIAADESIKGSKDAFLIARNNIADKLNIKLMKSAGITDALRINHIGETAGLDSMIGCMSESRLSISAGLHFALSQENVKYADLDSHFELLDDPAEEGFGFEDGYLIPLDRPGLGVDVRLGARTR